MRHKGKMIRRLILVISMIAIAGMGMYGMKIAKEVDGNVIESGSGDSLASILQQEAESKKFDIDVMDNRKNELVFKGSIDDFIDSYNGFYYKDNHVRYLLPSTEWRSEAYDTAIHSNHETLNYYFTEDEKVWTLPGISVYVPTNGDYIQEITLDFDDHSYRDTMYELYEEMCFYTLKVFFPDFPDDKIIEIYTTLNQLAYDNIVPNEQGFSSGSAPCALYYKDNVGLYPYFAYGESVHLCIIPVKQRTIKEFEKKGTRIYEIT